MRNRFLFLGIPTPLRKQLCRQYFKTAKKAKRVDWPFIQACWDQPYRELQYVALAYLAMMQRLLTPLDLPKLKALALSKSWWDTIDQLNRLVGNLALSFPTVNQTLLDWSQEDNLWLRRLAIEHQLLRKDKTAPKLLAQIIVNNLGSREFFINKAIGWALRDYSKTNPAWVKEFIEKYRAQLSPFSLREASKYL